jgi:steroid delta-isomerase-like uncharacterized protein
MRDPHQFGGCRRSTCRPSCGKKGLCAGLQIRCAPVLLRIWNAWSEPALEELLSPDIVFRGSLGTAVVGIAAFKQYVDRIRSAFPDFHNHIEELIEEGDKVAARLTYTGTHRGELFGFPGTGRKITYEGLAVFACKEGKIVRGFVVGDTETLKRQLAQK